MARSGPKPGGVTWPSKQEIYGTTIMVVLTTFLFGILFLALRLRSFQQGMSGTCSAIWDAKPRGVWKSVELLFEAGEL